MTKKAMVIIGVCALVVGAVAAGVWWRCGGNRPAANEVTPAEFEKIKGPWVRPDGGYVLDIKARLPDEGVEAAYFNPSPIRVGKAKLFKERGVIKVYVELQGPNYAGSTYTLHYDALNDQLAGVYYQAVQQMSYEIAFTRIEGGAPGK